MDKDMFTVFSELTKLEKVPTLNKSSFSCPHCHVFAHQEWYDIHASSESSGYWGIVPKVRVNRCFHCNNFSIWYETKLIHPRTSFAPPPCAEMPEDVRKEYNEASEVATSSPRAAAALLRLAVQKLMPHLGAKGQKLDDDIAYLVENGLPVKIQQALDSVRVIGNNAVHPGEMDINDDPQVVMSLFDIINFIVEYMIVRPARIDEIYSKLPAGARQAIEKRDK